MYISELIKDGYMQWKPGEKVFINTCTGSGKTTFVLNTLLPYAARSNQYIVLLVNRALLESQVNEMIHQKYSKYQRNIFVYTYQKYNQMQEHIMVDYLVLDEAHYFISDSSFNEYTAECFRELIQEYRHSVIVLMSATPEYIYLAMKNQYGIESPYITTGAHKHYSCYELDNLDELIYGKEYQYDFLNNENTSRENLKKLREAVEGIYYNLKNDRRLTNTASYRADEKWAINQLEKLTHYFRDCYERIWNTLKEVTDGAWVYNNRADYSYLDVMYYNRQEDLIERIKRNSKEKWLCFVNSKSKGEYLATELKQDGIDVIFLSKESRKKSKKSDEYQTYDQIARKNTYGQQVLIATSFMDNGVNIYDPAVKHITIDAENQTEFLQMLGRVRIDPTWENHQVTLYLENKSVGVIKRNFNNTIMENIRFMARFQYVKGQNVVDTDKVRTLRHKRIIRDGKIMPEYMKYLEKELFDAKAQHGEDFIVRKYGIKSFFMKKNSYDYYKMMAWLEEVYESEAKGEMFRRIGAEEEAEKYIIEYPWIKYQLKWIGKEYDPAKWIHIIGHSSVEKELYEMLECYCDADLLEGNQKYFRSLIIRYGASMQPPHPIADSKCSRIQMVNEAFREWGIPYFLEKKHKSIGGEQRDYWKIVKAVKA